MSRAVSCVNALTRAATRKAFRKLPKYTRKGWPDICLIRNGKFYSIEVKTDVGRLSPEQKELGGEIIANGGMYVVARSIDDVRAVGL